jgi:hypothetical protein
VFIFYLLFSNWNLKSRYEFHIELKKKKKKSKTYSKSITIAPKKGTKNFKPLKYVQNDPYLIGDYRCDFAFNSCNDHILLVTVYLDG